MRRLIGVFVGRTEGMFSHVVAHLLLHLFIQISILTIVDWIDSPKTIYWKSQIWILGISGYVI